ncbi:MAG: hypothetical protein ACYDCN_04665 [Bacteroidia bacterium]
MIAKDSKISIVLILLSIKCFSQEEPLYKNIVYAEGLGNAILYSINYERLVYKGEGFQDYVRVGFRLQKDTDWQYLSPKKSNLSYAIPLMFVHQRGIKKIKFEYGIGLLTAFGEPIRRGNLIGHTGSSPFDFGITGSLGLRYIPTKIPLFFKLCYTPVYSFTEKDGTGFLAGLSVGYAFKAKTKPALPSYDDIPNNIMRYPVEQDTITEKKKETGVRLPNNKIIYPVEQKKATYPDSTKKTYYSLMLDFPTTRGGILVGLERYQKINNLLSFASSFNTFAIPAYRQIFMEFCLQPFHLLVGKKQVKFETGLSVSYWNLDINTSTGRFNSNPLGSYFSYNIYFGVRYNFKRIPFHTHLAYVPYFRPYDYGASLFQPIGFEFGIGYIIHKSQAAQKRSAIRKQVEESH